MIREETKKVESIQHIHHFYCDRCGEEIGSSIEFDDGYVQPPCCACTDCNFVNIRFRDSLIKCPTNYDILCVECYNEVAEEIRNAVENIFYSPTE